MDLRRKLRGAAMVAVVIAAACAGTEAGMPGPQGNPASGITGVVGASNGGTGQSSFTIGDVLYASSASALSKLAAGTSGYALTSNGAGVAPSYQAVSGGGVSSPVFGSGSDGAVTFDGSTAYAAFATTTGSSPNKVYTLIRDVDASSCTVSAGKTVITAGYAICGGLALTVNGTVKNDGSAGSNDTGGVGGPGGRFGIGYDGGAGGLTGAGAAGSGHGAIGLGGSGGAGGAGGIGAGGVGGANAISASQGQGRTVLDAVSGWCSPNDDSYKAGGSGGGGSGDAVTGDAGGGGGGGGCVSLVAKTITVGAAGVVSSVGGAGGAATGTNSGGGGGGGGGVIWIVCNTHTNGGSETVAGGAGGAKTGTGVAGTAGSVGKVIVLTGY